MERSQAQPPANTERRPPPSGSSRTANPLLAMQRLAGNQAVSRLIAGANDKPSAPGQLGPLNALTGLAAAGPAAFTSHLSVATVGVSGALTTEQGAASLPELAAPTGLTPGPAVEVPAAPTVTEPAATTPAPTVAGDGLADPSAADQAATSSLAALHGAAAQTDVPAPKLGGSLTPTVDPVSLAAAPLPAAGALGSVPAGPAGSARETAVLDAAGGAEVHRLVGNLLHPAAAAGAAHAAAATAARVQTVQQINGIQTDSAGRQQALRTSADEEVQQEHSTWSAHRTELVDGNTRDIHAVAGQTKAEISQTAQAAQAQSAQAQSAQAQSDTTVNRDPEDGGLWGKVKKGAGAVVSAAKAVGGKILEILAIAKQKINGLLDGLLRAVQQRVLAAVNALREASTRAWSAIKGALDRAQQAITRLARAAIDAAKRLWAAAAVALARSWQKLVAAAKAALAAAAGIVRKLGAALAKVTQLLSLLDNPLLKYLLDAARDVKGKIVDPLIAKAAPHVSSVDGVAKDMVGQQAGQPQAQPTLTLQRDPEKNAQPAGDFSAAADRQMSADAGWFKANWVTVLAGVVSNVLWPVYLFTEEAPALWEECKGIFSPTPGLDRLDHFLGLARHLINIVNGTLATLGVWAGLVALAGGPVAEFFTVGAYYAISVGMIQVDIGIALAQLVKDWYSGSRPGITPENQNRYARMYSSTAISAIVTAVLVVLGIVAARFGAKIRGLLPKEPVKPAEVKPVTPVEEDTPVAPPVTAGPNWAGKPCPPDMPGYSGFHGTDTAPESVKRGGFGGGQNMDLKEHIHGRSSGDDAYMGTTGTPGGGHEGGGSSAWGKYVYKVHGPGWDCNSQYFRNEGVESPTRGETEIAVRRNVGWENVEGWYEPREHSSGKQIIGQMTPNPDFAAAPAKK